MNTKENLLNTRYILIKKEKNLKLLNDYSESIEKINIKKQALNHLGSLNKDDRYYKKIKE